MIAETYKGIRPAPVIPCPDHLENQLSGNYLMLKKKWGDIDRGNVARIISIRLLFWESRK
jgi:hypothetical protein